MTHAFADYKAIKAVNFSILKHMANSPLHYLHARENPSEDTTGRLRGRGTHTAVLEIERFMLDYACYKGEKGKKAIRRGKRWEAFRAMHAEENILTEAEYQHCIRAAKDVRRNPEAKAVLADGAPEQTIQWIDEETGLHCKARLDWLRDDGIYDLKGVRSTDLHSLSYEVAKSWYHCQLAFYQEGVKRALGKTLPVHIIAKEHRTPSTGVFLLDEDSVYAGWETVRNLLNQVAACEQSKHWPDRYEGVQTLRVPEYVFGNEFDADDLGFEMKDAGTEEESDAL